MTLAWIDLSKVIGAQRSEDGMTTLWLASGAVWTLPRALDDEEWESVVDGLHSKHTGTRATMALSHQPGVSP